MTVNRGRKRRGVAPSATQSYWQCDEAVADVESPLIKISAAVHGDGVLLSIKDNGVGLSKDIIGRAFEPYVTGKPSGTGLGLVVARRAVEDHGGRILCKTTRTAQSPKCGCRIAINNFAYFAKNPPSTGNNIPVI